MKEIKTRKGQTIFVDDNLFDYLNQFWWTISGGRYAYRQKIQKNGTRKKCYMHHEVIGRPTKKYPHTDHIDRSPLNNQKSNLRKVTVTQNAHNTPVRKHSKTGIKGVSTVRGASTFSARVSYKRKIYRLGNFKTAQLAHEAYLNAAKKLYADS